MWFIVNATNRCNLNCKTCLRSKQSAGDLDPELLKSLLPKLRLLGFTGVSITGGEPIMHPEFSRLVEVVTSEGFILGIVTNGIFYREYLKILEPHEERISFVAISLDSHTKEINDHIRGPGSFDGATRAIKAFKERGFFVKVSHVINKKNLEGLFPFVGFALELGADAVNLLGTIQTSENKALMLDDKERQGFLARLRILTSLFKNRVFCASSTGYSNEPIFCNNLNNLNDMTLDFMGDLIFCCDTVYRGAVLGRVDKENFEDLVDKYLDAQFKVKNARIRAVMHHQSTKTNDCNFCNRVLRQMIRG